MELGLWEQVVSFNHERKGPSIPVGGEVAIAFRGGGNVRPTGSIPAAGISTRFGGRLAINLGHCGLVPIQKRGFYENAPLNRQALSTLAGIEYRVSGIG